VRLRLLARATVVMAMHGATGLRTHEAADTSALLVQAVVDDGEAHCVEHALGAIGTSVSRSLWTIEPAHLRTWLIVEGLREVPDRNILPLLTPLSHRGSAEVLRDLLRFRPQLQKKTSFTDFVEAMLADPELIDAVHGAIDIEHAPSSLGEDLARRISDETKSETARRTMLGMVTKTQASAVLPVARAIVLANSSLALKHEALRVVIHHGADHDVEELLRRQPTLDDEDRGWLLYDGAKRELVDLSKLIWDLPAKEREHFLGFWRLLSKRIVDALSPDGMLEVFKRIADENRWPGTASTASELMDRLESDPSMVSAQMVDLLLRIVHRSSFDEQYRLWSLLSAAAVSHAESRRLVLQHWLDGGARFLYAPLNDEDIRWIMTLPFEASAATDAVVLAVLAGGTERSSTVRQWAEAVRPGIIQVFEEATTTTHHTMGQIDALEAARVQRQTEREATKRPIDAVVTGLLKKGITATRWRELIWLAIPPQHYSRSTDVAGSINDLNPEQRAQAISALLECLLDSTTEPSSSDRSFFLLEQELLLWLLSPSSRVDLQAWLKADVVRRFLPAVLDNQYGGVAGLVTAMFEAHPVVAADAARMALQRNLDDRRVELPAAWSMPTQVLVEPITEALLRKALSTPSSGIERKLLRILAERHPELACEVAITWLENDRGDREVLDSLAIAAPRIWFAQLSELTSEQRRRYLAVTTILGDFQRRHTTELFSYREAAVFFVWLDDVYPGPMSLRSGFLTGEDIAREWKAAALNRVWRGFDAGDPEATEELERLALTVPRLAAPLARDRVRQHLRNADRSVVTDGRGVWGSLSLSDALQILDSKNAYTKNADDLLEALIDELSSGFADAVSEDGELLFVVEQVPVKPRREVAWQAYLARYLRLRLPGAFFGREVHVRVDSDLDLIAVPLGDEEGAVGTVVIEVKLSDNPDVLTAVDTQLSRYTGTKQRHHGIYLVVYLDGQKKAAALTLKAHGLNADIVGYRKFLEARARDAPSDRRHRVVVIDGHQYAKEKFVAESATVPSNAKKAAAKIAAAKKKPAAKKTAAVKKTVAKKVVMKKTDTTETVEQQTTT